MIVFFIEIMNFKNKAMIINRLVMGIKNELSNNVVTCDDIQSAIYVNHYYMLVILLSHIWLFLILRLSAIFFYHVW